MGALIAAHPRQPNEPAYATTAQGKSATGGKMTFDRAAVAHAIQGTEVEIEAKNGTAKGSSTEQLHHRILPDARQKVTNDCPMEVVCELQGYLEMVEALERLREDICEVTTTDVAARDVVSEAIGEAETAEEKRVRVGLGEDFVRAVELTLLMSEAAPDSPEAETHHQELVRLLGERQHLLLDLQRVAMQFELDR
eukprot:GDKK01053047.1.p1 GENE.GDKK01053047.1~~GDKK01053047.1.p1  ORF type:complete len:195 (+),score=18.49 GDKK01053047.1:1-585(+)